MEIRQEGSRKTFKTSKRSRREKLEGILVRKLFLLPMKPIIESVVWGIPGRSVVKNPLTNAGNMSLILGFGKILWRGKWQPTLVFLPANGQRSLAGYSLRGCKESDTA